MVTGQVYTHTIPAMDIGIPCQTKPFKTNTLKAQFNSITNPKETERRDEDLPRIPYVQKSSAINKVMTENEMCNKLNIYVDPCELYANASCKLDIRSRLSPEDRIKACALLEPYISDALY